MIRKEHAMAWAAAKVVAFAAVLCVAGCAWATALDDIPGDTEIYTAAQTDAAIAAATGAIHVAEADFTPSNAVLVATIEATAPAPGNYAAVSNAAMNARSMTELGVRGEPQGEGSYFLVNGDVAGWVDGHDDPQDDGWYGPVHISPLAGGYYDLSTGLAHANFMLQGGDYAVTLSVGGETYHVQGFRSSLALRSDIPNMSGYATQQQATNAAVAVADAKISTNNAAFVSAVLAAPLVGASQSDLTELSEYGSYGTVGAALLALIAGLAALKRRVSSAETTISGKLDGSAAYPAWSGELHYPIGYIVWYSGRPWISNVEIYPVEPIEVPGEGSAWDIYEGTIYGQIAGKQDALTSAQLAAANSGATAAKVAAWDGYAAQIAQKANSADVNAALAAKANATDLPYAMVTPGEWEFSGISLDDYNVSDPVYKSSGFWGLQYASRESGIEYDTEVVGQANDLSVVFNGVDGPITATRPSLPGHLLDRAGNRVVVTGDTTLTLPAAVPGYIRDFLVRLEISGSTVPTITFQGQGSEAPNGADEIAYETDGDEFPVPDAEGNWLYSFTETAAGVFAVSLKKVNTVAQGGS